MGEVEEGRAESVSALIGEGLELLEARAKLEAVLTGLRGEVGELDDRARAQLDEAIRAADEAYRRRHVIHVALAAAERGHAVLTSDDTDIAAVDPGLVLVHV